MKTLFIHAKSNVDVSLPDDLLAQLPSRLAVITTTQHMHALSSVRKQLPKAIFAGTLLGCRADALGLIKNRIDATLYIGTGEFHPIQAALTTKKPVFVWNPVAKFFDKLSSSQVAAYERRTKAAVTCFYHARTVGVLVTTKQGQNNNMITSPTRSEKLNPVVRVCSRNDGKKYYVFVFDTLQLSDLENFPFIDVWLNTACSRIFDDAVPKLVNLQDLEFWEKEHAA